MKKILLAITAIIIALGAEARHLTDFVDPRIGSEGLGRTYIGPSMPYGMIKPSPDGISMPNSGWAPLPEPIKGFSQVHVSGTGGGQKYGNILLMPFTGQVSTPWLIPADRKDETIKAGYYATTLSDGINVQMTAADKAAIYKFAYPAGANPGLCIDAGAFLGMSDIPDQRETQQLVGSQIEVVSDHEVKGYNRVRGGWNNGRAYTVYFHAISDKPFSEIRTWKGTDISAKAWQADTHLPTGAMLRYAEGTDSVTVRIGISFLSELKAKENLLNEIPGNDFQAVYTRCIEEWNKKLSRITVPESTPEKLKRMLYTGIYHTMLMPTDRSGENPLWADDSPYYDDYYAIWDTYRTSMPLLSIIDSRRQVDMVNSLINICRRDGYLPDARSGNANGRTQGGSNAEIAIADAFVKGLGDIDFDLALDAMLKDADVPPGGNEEAEGRGGLAWYNSLGYIPFGVPRAGNRTIEYAFCDFAIAQVAKGMGRTDVYRRMMRQSQNWKNLWRSDYEHAGTKGFIMPRDEHGAWLDSLPQGHSTARRPMYEYTPVTFEGPWYTPWWDMFFYEASSWEYSLSIPHDVPSLIEICGGAADFEKRLDTFFDKGFYNVNNEPSFLTPCLYHWLGKPHRSSDRVHRIIADNFGDSPMGLPGNDDSGAMSSWLAFHMMGLYPNAGHDYYLINSPLLESVTIHTDGLPGLRRPGVDGGKQFTIATRNLSPENKYIVSATLRGEDYPYSTIRHADILEGGTLMLTMGSAPSGWGRQFAPEKPIAPSHKPSGAPATLKTIDIDHERIDSLTLVCRLHGQTRRYNVSFSPATDGSLTMHWDIIRNLHRQEGSFRMLPQALDHAGALDFTMPVHGQHITLPASLTAYVLSRDAMMSLADTGSMLYGGVTYTLTSATEAQLFLKGDDGSLMSVSTDPGLPLILQMINNPLEVDWEIKQ